ncbi:MAG: acetyl-CoA carboxylase biotin carboxyl carrier protein, partial [Pseudomonadota bacterium]
MDLRKLKKLIDLVQESGIAELEITEGEERVRIARGGAVSVTPFAAVPPLA